MPGILKKKKSNGISRLFRKKSARKDRKAAKTSVRDSVKKTGAPELSKKQAAKAAFLARTMTITEKAALKAAIAGGVSKAVHSDRAKKLLCDAVERFLQL